MPKRHLPHLVVSAALMFAVTGCTTDNPEPAGPVAPQSSPEIGDITEDVSTHASYEGRTVTLTGKVTQVITPTAFVLTGEEYNDDSILVLSTQHIDVRQWQEARVTGTVQRLRYTSDENPNLNVDDPYPDFTGEYYLLATSDPAVEPSSRTPNS